MHSLEIHQIYSIENINHPNDFHVYFEGGCLTFNAANGPLRFWYDGDLITITNNQDMKDFREKLFQQKLKESLKPTSPLVQGLKQELKELEEKRQILLNHIKTAKECI